MIKYLKSFYNVIIKDKNQHELHCWTNDFEDLDQAYEGLKRSNDETIIELNELNELKVKMENKILKKQVIMKNYG